MNKEKLVEVTMEGHCEFYSETGTEGGYWAFQDKRYSHIPYLEEQCSKCKKIGFIPENDIYIKPLDYRNDLEKQQNWIEQYKKDIFRIRRENRNLAREFGLQIDYRKPCQPGTHIWVLSYPEGISSYEGLHILKNGDKLTIFDKFNSEKVVWDGEIDLMQHGLFTEGALGFWIHASQKGIGRERWAKWFMEDYPAKLITRESKKDSLV